ncbi:MAG: MBL fold metallo-hydrolase [Gammaproteobacteria bacterium]
MKIHFVGHASILVEVDGVRILSDPWWRGPCFGAQWWTYPVPDIGTVGDGRLDYIYISHGHHDHLHHGTLKTLPHDAKVLVSRDLDLADSIRELDLAIDSKSSAAATSLNLKYVMSRSEPLGDVRDGDEGSWPPQWTCIFADVARLCYI